MEFKELDFGHAAREKMALGVTKLARAVKATLGPRGRNVVIQTRGGHHVTKDGVTVAKSIQFACPQENMGAQIVKEVAQKTVDVAGDGTTTATVLAEAIVTEGLRLVASRHDPMSLKRGIDKAVLEVIANVQEQAKPIETTESVRQVATISANGDQEIGGMVAKAVDAVGKGGIITIQESKGIETTLRLASGFEFDRGYITPHFINDQTHQRAVFENALLLLVDGHLNSMQALKDITPVLEHCHEQNIPIVVIAESIDSEPLNFMAINAYQKTLKCVVVKAPGYGSARKDMLDDLASITGATVKSASMRPGSKSVVHDLQISELGLIPKIEVYKDRTVILSRPGCEADVEQRVAEIDAKLADADMLFDRDILEKRKAKLIGGVGIISVGAATEVEMREKKDRYDDALAATRAAIAEGVVPGGGVALVRAASKLKNFTTGNKEEDAGVQIVLDAICVPLKTIAENAGQSGDVIVSDVRDRSEGTWGYDAYRLQMCDMFEAGIVDPAKVTRTALQNAASIAGLLLTTECVITTIPEKSE